MKPVTENNGLFNSEEDYNVYADVPTDGPEDEPLTDDEIGRDDEPLTDEELAEGDDLDNEDEIEDDDDELLGADSPDDEEEFGRDESATRQNF